MSAFDPWRSLAKPVVRRFMGRRVDKAMRVVPILFVVLTACASVPVSLPAPNAEVRPVVAKDDIRGRWAITSVNGRQVNDLWIELGGEGPANVTRRADGGLNVGPPQPRSRAYLGCNYWHPNGWTRNGDKLTLGREMSSRTEIGCHAATVALDDEAYAILNKTMTMEFTPPNHLRLINENGTLDLLRSDS